MIHNGTATSRAAAAAITPHARTLRDKIAGILARCADGCTADELECLTGMAGNTVRPRLVELRQQGLVIALPITRPTRSGRAARVYVTAPAPRQTELAEVL